MTPVTEAEHKKRGSYLGTEVDEKWYKRYRRDGFFARGSGEYWNRGQGKCNSL
jgi:hypothetical protein